LQLTEVKRIEVLFTAGVISIPMPVCRSSGSSSWQVGHFMWLHVRWYNILSVPVTVGYTPAGPAIRIDRAIRPMCYYYGPELSGERSWFAICIPTLRSMMLCRARYCYTTYLLSVSPSRDVEVPWSEVSARACSYGHRLGDF